MTVPAPRPVVAGPPWRRSDGLVLCLILLAAAALRLPHLDQPGFSDDECWKSELAAGNGSLHLRLPVDSVFHPIDPYDPRTAGPWWRVWTTMECTHPPLFYLGLRAWTAVFGHGDAAERAFAAVTSLAAVALLFDAARLLHGRAVAVWAALLMAVAAPQVTQARLTSNYALELAAVLAAVDALARVEVLGRSPRRLFALGGGVLAAALTHYFAAGALAGLAAYAGLRLRGRTRVLVVLAFAAAGGAFALCWGPFLWRQRHLFATDDPATLFLLDARPGHALRVLASVLAAPGEMLARVGPAAWGLAPLYVLPLVLARRRPALLLWAAVLLGAVGLLAALDLTRQTIHVAFARYLILAGPPTYVLIPALAAALPGRWLPRLVPAAAVVVCVATLGQAYRSTTVDPRPLAAQLGGRAGPDDLVVLADAGSWTANTAYLMLTRSLRPFPSPVAIVHGSPGPAVLAAAARSRRVFAFMIGGGDPRHLFPAMAPVGSIDDGSGRPAAWVLEPVARAAGP